MSSSAEASGRQFGGEYYARYYRDRGTRVAAPADFAKHARFVAAYAEMTELRVKRILDVGCGIGSFKPGFSRCFPRASYHGIELSAYACKRYGWQQASILHYTSATPFDLVICHDVLQYLDARDAGRAIANLDRLCRGFLYFSVLTSEDWRDNCDQSRTDGNVFLRDARWYRTRLRRYFRNAGGGVWFSRRAEIVAYALSVAD